MRILAAGTLLSTPPKPLAGADGEGGLALPRSAADVMSIMRGADGHVDCAGLAPCKHGLAVGIACRQPDLQSNWRIGSKEAVIIAAKAVTRILVDRQTRVSGGKESSEKGLGLPKKPTLHSWIIS